MENMKDGESRSKTAVYSYMFSPLKTHNNSSVIHIHHLLIRERALLKLKGRSKPVGKAVFSRRILQGQALALFFLSRFELSAFLQRPYQPHLCRKAVYMWKFDLEVRFPSSTSQAGKSCVSKTGVATDQDRL